MRRIYLIFIVITLITGCSQTNNNEVLIEGTTEELLVSWNFEYIESKDVDGLYRTNAYVNLVSSEEKSIYIGEFFGYLKEDNPIDSVLDYPENSILACRSWYAGSGDLLCVIEDENRLVVKHKIVGESGGDPEVAEELDNMIFEEIHTINIDENVNIVVK